MTFEWLRVNDTFHDIVLEAAGMPLLRRMAHSVRRALRTPPLLLSQDVQRLHAENLRQHRALLEALRAGSPRAARELMADHILTTGRLIDVILDRTSGNGHAPDHGAGGARDVRRRRRRGDRRHGRRRARPRRS